MQQPHAVHQPYRLATDGTSHGVSLLSRKRVSLILAGAFLCAVVAALIVSSHATGSRDTARETPHQPDTAVTNPAPQAPALTDTAATGTDPPPGGDARNTTSTTVNVNGKNIPVPANGNTSQTVSNSSGTTMVDVTNSSSSTRSSSTNSSSNSLNVQVNSHSSSSSESVQ